MWNAPARLRSTHRDPVVGLKPFVLPAGVLSFVQAPDVILASRIQLPGTQTTSDLHDMISPTEGRIPASPIAARPCASRPPGPPACALAVGGGYRRR
ncbi:hypothetical protein OHA98_20585 [Streptomyces sp. NBC_00654]|uniref:hypothetical protein n=1 Tax=Streptomyces sp. NBC_00654 TaxID=2975799 RepID=UPI0022597073|nr:hypothetical protein [Streptomyces sp. NBC_00654]MCX4967143.1 hypothetical protein [Streptomyces sp. NBC_00654]